MRPETRSIFIAVLTGMMAAAYLHSAGKIDLSFGFAEGGPAEGAFIALIGAMAGFLILLCFWGLRRLVRIAHK